MENSGEIINKVAESSLHSFDLEELYSAGKRMSFDISECLYEGLILREKDFREFVKNEDWSRYTDAYVNVNCSSDAIVPTWAFMLLASRIEKYAKKLVFGNPLKLEEVLFSESIAKIDFELYRDKRVVVKGCSKVEVPVSAYVELTAKLTPVVKSIMYGEPCSTVPVYKKQA